jgi:hypothetical protein
VTGDFFRISAAEYGKPFGVGANSIHSWDRGNGRARARRLQAIAAPRGAGKRQVRAKLEQLNGEAAVREHKRTTL